MNKVVFLSIACDADPDVTPSCRELGTGGGDCVWRGITTGIDRLRQRLKNTSFSSKYGQLPVTWLLPADQLISQLYGNAAFCFQKFERLWRREMQQGSEIGWHPHLWRWDPERNRWKPYLGRDDDVELLRECLQCLRQHVDIRAVRTGWDYHSNRLMGLFDEQGLLVDASAIPGCTQIGDWFYDWRESGRAPFWPSKQDYRKSGVSPESSRQICEMPILVRRLGWPAHLVRYGIRELKSVTTRRANDQRHLTDWESTRWQGILVTSRGDPFEEAARQTIAAQAGAENIFVTAHFHAGELLVSHLLERFVHNLERLSRLVERDGGRLVLTTLTAAASLVKR